MNPIKQIWKEIRKLGFRNELFPSLAAVIDRLSLTIRNLFPLAHPAYYCSQMDYVLFLISF